jgi:hypothetical protein
MHHYAVLVGSIRVATEVVLVRPQQQFDLGRPAVLRWVYETVLREATRAEDLTGFLNGDTLVAIWPDLWLPKGVRRAWDDCHPVLRGATRAAG